MNTLLERVQLSNTKISQYLLLLESSEYKLSDGKTIKIVDGVAESDGTILLAGKYPVGEDRFIEIGDGGAVVSLPAGIESVVTEPVSEVTVDVDEPIAPVDEILPVESPELVEMKARILELEAIIATKETQEALFLAEIEKNELLISKLTVKAVKPATISQVNLSADNKVELASEKTKEKDYFAKQLDKVFK